MGCGYGQPHACRLPGQEAAANAAASREAAMAAGEQDLFAVYFWAPLLIVLGLIVGYWLGAWARTRPFFKSAGSRAGNWLSASGQSVVQHTVAAGKKLSPMPYLDKLRMGFASVMPRPVKLWLCVRCIEREDTAGGMVYRVQVTYLQASGYFQSCTHLGYCRENYRGATNGATCQAACPGSSQWITHCMVPDPWILSAWKKDLRRQLRPRLYRSRRSALRRARRELPALNPHVA